jgi:hypothetical protein
MAYITRDSIINALTVSDYGQRRVFTKAMPTNSVANTFSTLWDSDGIPVAGAYGGAAYTAVQCTSATTGAFSFTNPTSPRNLFCLGASAWSVTANSYGSIIVLDRLLQYDGINHATVGTTNMTNGVTLPRYTTGAGVMAFLEVTTVLNATAHTVQLTYTDQSGNSGNTTTAITPTASSAVRRVPYTGLYFPLASGDTGIRSVQNVIIASGGAPTGTSSLILAKPLFEIPLYDIAVKERYEAMTEELDLPELYDDHCLMFLIASNSAATTPKYVGRMRVVELAVA